MAERERSGLAALIPSEEECARIPTRRSTAVFERMAREREEPPARSALGLGVRVDACLAADELRLVDPETGRVLARLVGLPEPGEGSA